MRIGLALTKGITGAILSLLLFTLFSSPAHAQSSSAIAQSFTADTAQGNIVNGALVSTKGSESTVELATLETMSRLVGVVDGNPLVSLSDSGQEIEVVLSGTTDVLASDINGTIKSGDKITISPIAGVGMKATTDSQVIGTAQGSFTSTSTQSITDRSGRRRNVHLGYVRTQVGIATYQAPGSSFLPPFIQNIANSIAGRPVSLLRVLACSVLLLLGFLAVIILVFTSTRSAMTSLGRNPLAAHAIRRGLYQVLTISLVAIGFTLVASYLILTV